MKKIQVNNKILCDAISIASKFCSKKSTLPILSSIKVDITENGECTLSSFNSENFISKRINIHNISNECMSFCINLENGLFAFLKTISSDELLSIEVDEQNIKIKHSKGVADFPIISSSEFPEPKRFEDSECNTVSISPILLKEYINNGKFFVSTDELRPVLCGLYFDIKDNHLNVCATDARRLYTDSNPYISEKEFSFIVSGGALSAINDIASLSSKDLLFEINQSNIRIKSDDCDIVCRNVEGRFPNFRAVVISDDAIKTKVRFVTQDFVSMLNRMSIVNKGTNRLLILDIKNGKCNVMSEDVDYNKKNVENIECEIKGEDVKIGLNTEYLLNMVQTIDNDKFVMYIAESSRPILIREQTKPNKTLLLTPMTL